MLEYPAYMLKTPSTASAYLLGDVASFSCYQTHWIKGDYEYKCIFSIILLLFIYTNIKNV